MDDRLAQEKDIIRRLQVLLRLSQRVQPMDRMPSVSLVASIQYYDDFQYDSYAPKLCYIASQLCFVLGSDEDKYCHGPCGQW